MIGGVVEGFYFDVMFICFLLVLFDCDFGIDDVFVLVYLVSCDDVEIVGVVMIVGNVGQDDVLCNVLGLIELFGMDVLVVCGVDVFFVELVMIVEEIYGFYGLGYVQLGDCGCYFDGCSGV